MACQVKESMARGLPVWGGEGTAPGFVAPEWALVVIQPKTGDHSCGTLGLVMGRRRPQGRESSFRWPVQDPAPELPEGDNL